jgi:class 3 adenylate cyclase
VAGNMRSKQRFAVIGDTVNVARRVLTKDLIQLFLISDELAQIINYDLPSKEIPDYLIRGQNEPLDLVKIYQL